MVGKDQEKKSELAAFSENPEYETYSKIATYSKLLETPHFEEEAILNNCQGQKNNYKKLFLYIKVGF